MATEKPWERGCFSAVVLVEIEKMEEHITRFSVKKNTMEKTNHTKRETKIIIVILSKQYLNTSASIDIQQRTHDCMSNVSHLPTVNQRI